MDTRVSVDNTGWASYKLLSVESKVKGEQQGNYSEIIHEISDVLIPQVYIDRSIKSFFIKRTTEQVCAGFEHRRLQNKH